MLRRIPASRIPPFLPVQGHPRRPQLIDSAQQIEDGLILLNRYTGWHLSRVRIPPPLPLIFLQPTKCDRHLNLLN
jgi:hypothetical protein